MNTAAALMPILYGIIIMGILLDFRVQTLSKKQRYTFLIHLFLLFSVNAAVVRHLGNAEYGKFYPILVQFPLYLEFCLFSRYKGVKVFFVLLSTIIFAAPPVMFVVALRSFYHISMTVSVFTFLICYTLMILFVYRFLKQDFNYMMETCEDRNIWQFCLIPVLGYIYSFARTKYNFITPMAKEGYLIQRIPTLIVFSSYILLIRIFRIAHENEQLQMEKNLISIQMRGAQAYLNELRFSNEQTRIYRHNMRHHLSLLNLFAAEGNLSKIKDYLAESEKNIDSFTPVRYCDNEIIHLILASFALRAKKSEVSFVTNVRLPASVPISDTEICSLFSNSLENAVSAAAQLPDPAMRKVSVQAAVKNNSLVLSIKNPYIGTVEMDGELPKSQNPESGHGFGIKSMVQITEHYGGLYSIDTDGGIFTLRLLLPFPPNAS